MNLCNCDPHDHGSNQKTAGTAGCGCNLPVPGPGLFLAIAAVPVQPWETPYDGAKGLKQGTIFPSLDLPFFAAGGENNG